jgi:hypothetical protein
MSASLMSNTVDSISAIGDALMQSVDSEGIKEVLMRSINKVKAEQLEGQGEQDTPISGVGAPQKQEGQNGEMLSPVQAFYLETEKLMEAQLARHMTQNELTLSQYQTEMEMLSTQLANKEITKAEHDKRMIDLDKKTGELSKKINKDNMEQGLAILVSGSGKAQKFMEKVAIYQAIMKGKTAAVSAWEAGMATGGPFAPVVAAAYTAASIARTGSMIASIKSGGSSSSGGGGGGAAAVNAGQAQSNQSASQSTQQQAPSRVFNVDFGGDSSGGTQQTRNLLELINEQAGDNVQINLRGG